MDDANVELAPRRTSIPELNKRFLQYPPGTGLMLALSGWIGAQRKSTTA
jgi:hypothetical protein